MTMTTRIEIRNSLEAELKAKLICRFCLTQQTGKLSNIYAKNSRVRSLVPLPVQVMSVASMEVYSNDDMPMTICIECRLLFDFCYRFKVMCRQAENLLRQVPLTGQWPEALSKPPVPDQLLTGKTFINSTSLIKLHSKPQPSSKLEQQCQQAQTIPQQASESLAVKDQQIILEPVTLQTTPKSSEKCNVKVEKKCVSQAPKKILNSNPVASPEPPVPKRIKKIKLNEENGNLICKVENDEDLKSILLPSVDTEFTAPKMVQNKPKLLNKSSVRILNKDAEIDIEPRLSLPKVQEDEDGNMSIVTEIIDPSVPYETEPDPIKNAKPVETHVFPCAHCDRTFPLLQLRDIHMVNHTRERLFPCTDCERSFFSKYDLQKHTVIHTGEKKYKCTVCNRGFTRPTLLYRHEKIHTDIPKFLCVYCEKPFLSLDEMEKHAERHKKNRPFKCKICSKTFAFKQGVERHEVVHLRDQPYPCQYCDQSFCTSSKLARHLQAHAGQRPYPCKYCPKSYLLSHHLTRHMRSHKESVVLYSCNECDKVYKTCDDLIYHSTVHATVTLQCPLCQLAFEDVATVTAHIREHSKNEAYACEFCDLMFLSFEHQKEHINRTHAEEMKAYHEDDKIANSAKNQRKSQVQPKIDETDLEKTIQEFLTDENADDCDSLTMSNKEIKIEKDDETSELDMSIEEEYLSLDENDIPKDYESPPKKTKADIKIISNESLPPIETLSVHRKIPAAATPAPTGNSENKQLPASLNHLINSLPKGVSLRRNLPTGGTQVVNSEQVAVTTRAATKRLSDGASSTSPQSQTPSTLSSPTNIEKSTDKVVKMKLGQNYVKVQKIMISKAEAAAMAKQGRIQMKDGNMILTQGPSSAKK